MRQQYDKIMTSMEKDNFETFAENIEDTYHNTGHGAIANGCSDSCKMGADSCWKRSVMGSPATSARDPIFYRWHTHIEDLFQMYNKKRKRSYGRSIFALTGGLKVLEVKTIMDKTKLGTSKDVENILVTFDESYTERRTHHKYRRLNHHPFKYQIKVSNPQRRSKKVIIRIFLTLGKCLKYFYETNVKINTPNYCKLNKT